MKTHFGALPAFAVGLFIVLLSACDGSSADAPHCTAGGPPAQFRAQTLPSGAVTPGTTSEVSVSFDNCSGQTWTAADYRLAPTDPAAIWGVPFVHLIADVAAGDRATFSFRVTAPKQPGSYPYSWGILRDDGAQMLEERSPLEQIAVLAPIDCSSAGPPARLIGETLPPNKMVPGQSADTSITFGNCSTDVWTHANGFRLAATDGLATWGKSGIDLTSDVPTGYAIEIPLRVVAPAQPGVYAYRWGIAHNTTFIDKPDPGESIEVVPCIGAACVQAGQCPAGSPPSRFVAETTPPSSMQPGQSALVSETFVNCSGQTWSASNVQLGSQFPQDSTTWNAGRVPLPADVPPGDQVQIFFQATAPTTPGQYGFQWEMVGATAWVPQMSPGKWITVGPAPPAATFAWTHPRVMYNFVSPTTANANQITQIQQLADAGMNVWILNSNAPLDKVVAAVRANPQLSRYRYMPTFGWAPFCGPSTPVADCRQLTDWIDALVKIELENPDIFAGYYTFDEPGETWNGCTVPGAEISGVHAYIRSRDPDATHRPVALANTLLFWQTYSCGASFFPKDGQDIVFIDQYNQNSPTVEDYANQVIAFQGWKNYGFPLDRVLFVLPSYLPSSRGCTSMDLVGFASTLYQAARAVYGGGWNGNIGYGYFAYDCAPLGSSTAYGIDNCGALFSSTTTQCAQ